MDKWLLSKLNTLIGEVDDDLGNYRIPEAARALQTFVDDMSNWYVRRGRERYWVSGMPQDKINAYMTLYTALVTVAKLAAPMIPFMAEDIYRNLVCSLDKSAPESVHLCDFPVADASLIDKELEGDMDRLLEAVVLGRAARNNANLKNRQPLSRMIVCADGEIPEMYRGILADELNVHEVCVADDMSEYISYSFKPQLKTVGPKFGSKLGQIRAVLPTLDGNAAKAELDATGKLTLHLDDGDIQLLTEDLLIEVTSKEGYVTATEGGVTVALCTTLTDELIEEGLVREFVSKIQTMRKEADFNVTDHITVTIEGDGAAVNAAEKHGAAGAGDVLADSVVFGKADGFVKQWDLNGEQVTIGVKR